MAKRKQSLAIAASSLSLSVSSQGTITMVAMQVVLASLLAGWLANRQHACLPGLVSLFYGVIALYTHMKMMGAIHIYRRLYMYVLVWKVHT